MASDEPNQRKKSNRKRPNTKLTGERSEASFLQRAANLGFGVNRPWGDSLRYDFILDNGERLHRVQVKCTECVRAGAYETRATYTTGNTRAAYTSKDCDFIAAHVVPLDLWYIIPVEICTPQPMLRFYPHRKAKRMRLEKYREAWRLLKPSNHKGDGPITIYACVDENWPEKLWLSAVPQGPPKIARRFQRREKSHSGWNPVPLGTAEINALGPHRR